MNDEFVLRGHCGPGWPVSLVILDVSGDLLIAGAYFAIPALMLRMLRRFHVEFPYRKLWALYVVFIMLCGFTHLVTPLTYFYPAYWLEASVKIMTALASVATVFVLARSIPLILRSLDEAAHWKSYAKAAIQETMDECRRLGAPDPKQGADGTGT